MCCGLPGHDVPDHGGRAGQVVVAEVEGAQGGHVGEGGGGDEGQLVGGHVEAGQLRQVEAGQDGERGVGEVQHLHAELQTCHIQHTDQGAAYNHVGAYYDFTILFTKVLIHLTKPKN